MRYWVAVALLVAAILWMSFAHAAEPPGADPALREWFRSLQTAAGGSCCGMADGHVLSDADWRVVGDEYEIRIDGEWVPVEAAAVLDRVENPTGGAVAFWSPGAAPHRVFCFVRPSEV